MTADTPRRPADTSWSTRPERGSTTLVHFMTWLSLSFGWGAAQVLLTPIALYFVLASPAARANSRRFLARALGRKPHWGDVFRHVLVFANVILDRLFLLSGRHAGYRIEVAGEDAVARALAARPGRGCILLGAHLGSFEVLRAIGRRSPAPVRPLMYRANGGAFSRVLERLDPSLPRDMIEIGTPDAMLQVQETLGRGEIVGILGDRAPASDRRRTIRVDFLGAPATFPTSPLLLAARLDVPVVLFFGLRTGTRAYHVEFAPLALHVTPETVPACIARYARELEARCRVHPFNWFNFHDFWHDPSDGVAAAGAAGSAGRRAGARPG